MKQITLKILVTLALLMPALATALDPSEVKDYGEVFAIEAEAVSRDLVEISWEIAPGYYLYNNDFLAFRRQSMGEGGHGRGSPSRVLGKAQTIPRG